jgi:hypothetical protein
MFPLEDFSAKKESGEAEKTFKEELSKFLDNNH